MSADFLNIFIDDNGLETYSQEEVFQDVMVKSQFLDLLSIKILDGEVF